MHNFPQHSFERSRDETPCEWLIEPLRSRADFSMRRTFGCWSFYLGEKNVLLFVPANAKIGDLNEAILVPSEKQFHESLMKEFPQLEPHELLKKWLCISDSSPDYEETAEAIVALILRGDKRLGVLGHIRKRSRKRATSKKRDSK